MTVTKHKPENAGLGMLRIDLRESLCQSTVDPQLLSSFQRILLTTDGTVTEILEAHLWEAMRIVKLYQDCIETDASVPYLDIGPHAPVLVRKIILRGESSERNYIYAESVVALDRLDDRIRLGLIETQKPVGQLMLEARLETFREILSCCYEPAEEIGEYLGVSPDARLISRTYRVFANRQPFMLITEKFPDTAFRG
jgi:chorismate-pyruvate lyase